MLQLFSKMQDATLDAELHHEGLSLSRLSSFCGLPAGLRDRMHALMLKQNISWYRQSSLPLPGAKRGFAWFPSCLKLNAV